MELTQQRDFRAIPGLTQNVWGQAQLAQKYPKLMENSTADVVIVGAGISGLSCAYNLVREGKDVIVLESRVRCGGTTGRSTAHAMKWYDDYFSSMESEHGLEKTKLLAESYNFALNSIEEVVHREQIDCDFARVDGYLYPHSTADAKTTREAQKVLQKELESTHRVGLTDTKLVDLGGGPEVGGIRDALLFPGCVELDPIRFCDALADCITKSGGRIHEMTRVKNAVGDHVETVDGLSIKCKNTILATNSPINKNLAIHARQEPYRTYAVGLKIRRADFHHANYWDTHDPYHYVRCARFDDEYDVLIVGGADHKTGHTSCDDPYDDLVRYARDRWTKATDVLYRWGGQVMEPADGLHIIGKDPMKSSETYVITGDSGQGITSSQIGANVITDLIMERTNKWADLYSPSRLPGLGEIPGIAAEGMTAVGSLLERVVPNLFSHATDMEPNSGRVIQSGIHKVAVFNDADGLKHCTTAVCPHMGCIVHWDKVEKGWQCPCHGTCFDALGVCIHGPAVSNLEPFDMTF